MERTVRIKDTQSNVISDPITIEASTFGELKKELKRDFKKSRVIVRETRATLELDDAKLPDGSFTLYVYPEKTKSGAGATDDLQVSDVNKLSFHALRSECSSRDLQANGITKREMQENLKDWIRNNSPQSDLVERVESLEENFSETMAQVKQVIATSNDKEEVAAAESWIESIEGDFDAVRKELGI